MLHNGPIYTLSNIQRNGSGVLRCIASNFVGTSEPVNIYIDVQCKSNNQSYVKANKVRFISGTHIVLKHWNEYMSIHVNNINCR